MPLKTLTPLQRLFAGTGCVLGLVLLLGGVALAFWSLAREHRLAQAAQTLPAGWLDTVRAATRIPVVTDLALLRRAPGDGATALRDTAGMRAPAGVDHAYRALVGTTEATAADSAVWRALDTSTALDRWVAAARHAEWRALDRMLGAADSTIATRNLFALPLPSYNLVRRAGYALVVRGLRRAQRGDRGGARTDLGAAMGLGEQLARREPGMLGVMVGRAVMSASATGWMRLGEGERDRVLVTRAAAVKAWATWRPQFLGNDLGALPDSAIALAHDTTVAMGVRVFAMEQLLLGALLRPWQLLLGPPGRVRDALRTLEQDRDPDLARVAAIASTTAGRLNAFGARGLMREMGGGTAR